MFVAKPGHNTPKIGPEETSHSQLRKKHKNIYFWVIRQVVTDSSSDTAQLVERQASNQKVTNLGSTTDMVVWHMSFRKMPNVILG